MARRGSAMKFATAFAAVSLVTGSAASAAPRTVDPLLALSVFASEESRAAVCAAGAAAAAAAGAAVAAQAAPAAPGCVLPVVDAAPPMVDTAPPPMVAPPVVETGGKSLGILPLLLGLAAITAAALLLLDDDDDDEIEIPVSPA
jgi:hypothetical protein